MSSCFEEQSGCCSVSFDTSIQSFVRNLLGVVRRYSMRNHYHPLKARDPSLLPRVLGLTASPIYNARRPQKTIECVPFVMISSPLITADDDSKNLTAISKLYSTREYSRLPLSNPVKSLNSLEKLRNSSYFTRRTLPRSSYEIVIKCY